MKIQAFLILFIFTNLAILAPTDQNQSEENGRITDIPDFENEATDDNFDAEWEGLRDYSTSYRSSMNSTTVSSKVEAPFPIQNVDNE